MSEIIKTSMPIDETDLHSNKHAGRFPKWIDNILNGVLALIMFSELLLLFGSIVYREVTGQSLSWGEEVAGISLTAIAFIGGAIAYYEGSHLSVRLLVDKLPERWRLFTDALGSWLILGLAVICLTYIYPHITSGIESVTPALGISKSWLFLPYVIGMILVVMIALKHLSAFDRRVLFSSCCAMLLLLAGWYAVQHFTGPWDGLDGIIFAGVMLMVTIAIGLPIGFGLPMVTGLYLVSSGVSGIGAMPMAMANGISGFIFLAIPFFVLAGDIMTEGGLTLPMANFVRAIVGRTHGGLMQVLVGSMFIFSGISGSKVADVAAVGTTLKSTLKEQGFEPEESSAVLAASAIMGETIPPSLPLLLLGSITSVSVGSLFVAGMVPAVLMAVILMIFIYFKARANNWPRGDKYSWTERYKLTLRALPVLFVPVMLVIGIASGIATPTEVSSFAVVYAIIAALFFYKSVGIRGLVKIFTKSGIISGMILFTISAGATFSWAMTIAGLQQMIVDFMNYLGGSSAVFLLVSLVALVILGGILEGLPALLVTVPSLMPIAVQFGIDPLHYAILLIFAMGMGAFMPPFGIGFYVSCTIGGSSPEKVTPRLMPYLIVLGIGLLMVTFIPWFTLALPKLLHM